MKLFFKYILISWIFLSLQGCIVPAVMVGVAAVKYGNSKKKEANIKCDDAYNQYLEIMLKNHKQPMPMGEYCAGYIPKK
jgi:hypothetical protein